MAPLGTKGRSNTRLLNVCEIIKIDCSKLLLPELFKPAKTVTGANFSSPELTIGLKFSIDQLFSIFVPFIWLQRCDVYLLIVSSFPELGNRHGSLFI